MNLDEVLKTREEKWENAIRLTLRSRKSVISVTLNSPGETKKIPETLKALTLVIRDVLLALEEKNITFDEFIFTRKGAYPYFIASFRGNPEEIKKIAVELEEKHPIGRLLDIDVLRPDGSKISRKELGLSERKCFLCSSPWIECVKNQKHSKKEIERFYKKALKEFLKERENR